MRARIAELEWQLDKQVGNHRNENVVLHTDLGSKVTPPATDAGGGAFTPAPIPPISVDYHAHGLIDPTLQGLMTPASSTGIETSPTTASLIFPVSTANNPTTAMTAAAAATAPLENGGFPVWMDWQGVAMGNCGMMAGAEMGEMLHFEPEPASPVRVLGCVTMTHLVLADLNQIYFDRVHAVLPMVHRGRYFSWADQEKPSPARVCLRSAMHTVAAAMSAQYLGLSDALFQETYRLLELQQSRMKIRNSSRTETMWMTTMQTYPKSPVSDKSDNSEGGERIPLELIQAWLLLAHYEFLRVNEHQAMLTAGRAFRLVQLARLYSVDDDAPELETDEAHLTTECRFVISEEKRRTFWLAFSFDRFLCSRNEWPLTLQEEAVRTRLPAPESSFQNAQPIRMSFLSEVLPMTATAGTQCDASAMVPLPPFTEYVVLSALHGRCMVHRRVSLLTTDLAGKQDSYLWYNMLAAAASKRIQLLAQSQPPKTLHGDPMALFTHMLAHRLLIYLSNTLELASWQQPKQPKQKEAGDEQQATYYLRARRATREILRLAEFARSLSCFGIHPFMAKPLACAADFFIREASGVDGNGLGDEYVDIILHVMRNMGNVSILARDYLRTLETHYHARCAKRRLERC